MERTKVFRAVRISTASLCFLASLLCLALWVRSHHQIDGVRHFVSDKHYVAIYSINGTVRAVSEDYASGWSYNASTVSRYDWGPGEPTTFGFRFLSYPAGVLICLPYWFLSFAFGGIGIALLMNWFRRFTIRRVLVLITIMAIVLGLMVHKPN